ncbi:MAG: efflux RND transporter permease subunit [Acidobacteriota bacterium]
MTWFITTALRLRVALVAASVLLMITGVQTVQRAPMDVFPEFAPPRVEVQTEGPGLSATQVEALITVPIENALNGVFGVSTIRSKSVLGLSSVVLFFKPGTDLLQARQLVQERLTTLSGQLPSVSQTPVILQPLSATSRVLKIGLSSQVLSQVQLSTLARWTVRPRLMAVPGVANVAIWGQRDRQIQVLVEPERLRDHNVTLKDVVEATHEAVLPAAGGFIDTPNQRLAVQHLSTVYKPEDLEHIPVAYPNGQPLELGTVAEVVEGYPAPIGDAVINDGPGILLIVEKQPTGNTLDVTRGVERALETLKPALAGVAVDSTIFRPATFIEMSIHNLQEALGYGCLLVAAVLIAFLFEWRTAVISLTAIPLSLVVAAVLISWQGQTINTMVLAGLAIALGEVVDDAIIDVENINRRLRLNREAGNPVSSFEVVLKASLEVRSAVVFASLILVLVFVPVFLLGGLAGSFFRPLATSYILAVAASLLVALSITPALSLILLPGAPPKKAESPVSRFLKTQYRALLPWCLDRRRLLVTLLAIALSGTLLTIPFLGEEFLPNFQEYDFLMHWVEKPGTSIDAMRRITVRASKELRSIPGVRNFGAHIGRAEVADEVVGPNFTELWISLDPLAPYQETVARIQEVVNGYPGLYRDLLTYLKERIKEVLTGGSAAIVVRLYGPELDGLRSKAQEVAGAIDGVKGISDLQIERQTLIPQVEVRIQEDQARRFGLSSGLIRDTAATLVQGLKVGEIYEAQKIFDVTVWGVASARQNLDSIRNLWLTTPSHAKVPLREVAEVRIVPTPNEISRENGSRKIDISCNVRGRDLGTVARDVERAVRELSYDQGYHPEILGEYAARQEARDRLFAAAALSLAAIILILYSDFQSTRITFLLVLSLPFALVGAVWSAFLAGGTLSLGSLVGFVTVVGIAARNAIMLVSHYRHLQREESVPFGRDLILRGAEERLAPILMTALTTALALLPIIVGGNRPGYEIEHPMAVVIVGGLFTSTVLNLFLTPILFESFARRIPNNW